MAEREKQMKLMLLVISMMIFMLLEEVQLNNFATFVFVSLLFLGFIFGGNARGNK